MSFPKRVNYEDAKDWEIDCLKFRINQLLEENKRLAEEWKELGKRFNRFINSAYEIHAERGIRQQI